jgi:hypothetical protein
MEDIAIGLINGDHRYKESVVQGNAALYDLGIVHTIVPPSGFDNGKDSCTFRAAFDALEQKAPSAKWYYVADADVMINGDKLTSYLRTFDYTKPIAIAGRTHCRTEDYCGFVDTRALNGMYGGPGVVLSAALAKKIQWSARECCKDEKPYDPHFAADGDLTCTLLQQSPDMELIRPPTELGFDMNKTFEGDGRLSALCDGSHPGMGPVHGNQIVVHHVSPGAQLKFGKKVDTAGLATYQLHYVRQNFAPACTTKNEHKRCHKIDKPLPDLPGVS